MKKLLLVVLALAVGFVAWKTFSTLDVQGFWHAQLERPEGQVAFDYHILPARSGMDAWISVRGAPQRTMDALDLQRHRIRFDLPVDGRVYHLDGTADQRRIEGTWRLDDGHTGAWHAQRYSVRKG